MALTRDVGADEQWTFQSYEERQDLLILWALKFYAISDEGKKATGGESGVRASPDEPHPPTPWLVRQNEKSPYADVEGEAYDYLKTTKHGRLQPEELYTLAPGDFVICFRRDKQPSPGVFGIGRVRTVEDEGVSRVALYDWYEAIDPPIPLTDVASLPENWNPRNPIHEVDATYVEALLAHANIARPQVNPSVAESARA